ncbi:MAG: hypothetical protein JXJ22_05045, partial [Bacteroidales bacterium]|nr:hypothetical protein [Bacteroidales bacterium]
ARPGKPNTCCLKQINLKINSDREELALYPIANLMIMKNYYLYFFIVFIVFLVSCNQEDINTNDLVEVNEVYAENNMFVFQSYDHINKMISTVNSLNLNDKIKWFEKYGVETYGQVFYKVIQNEDSISDYYFSLPESEQHFYRSQPQVHSEIYKNALERGIIKEVISDGNKYFDINLVDKKYADFLNLGGKLIIGDNVISVDESEEKVYLDCNNLFNNDYINEEFILLKSKVNSTNNLKSSDPYDWSEVKSAIYYAPNIFGTKMKKVWAEIEGSSHLYEGGAAYSTCSNLVYCDFILKAYAQKRNFWGNFIYTSSFRPAIELEGYYTYKHASWNYDDPALNDECLCGYYSTNISYGYNDLNSSYPSSPVDIEVSANNWIQQPVSPDGVHHFTDGSGGYWWARPIMVYNANITITIDGYSFTFQW